MKTRFTVIVPEGETLKDWGALPPSEVVAVIVKEFAVRDCAAVGVHDNVLPFSVAPVGAVVSWKLTVPPAGSVAATL